MVLSEYISPMTNFAMCLYRVVELVGGGSVINGVTSSSFYPLYCATMWKLDMLHSQIQMQMHFWPFSRNAYTCNILGKLSENHFYKGLFPNPSLRVWNLGNKITLSEWIGEQPCMQMDFRQFFRNDMFVSISGKLSAIYLHAQLFSNPCGKVLFNSKMLFIIPNVIWNVNFLSLIYYFVSQQHIFETCFGKQVR